MKKLLSLTLSIIMIISSCISISGIPVVQAGTTADAEGFVSVYLEGFESSADPSGGKTNIWSNNSVLSSDNTDKKISILHSIRLAISAKVFPSLYQMKILAQSL